MDKVRKFTESQLKNKVDLKVGDTVKVHQKIKEGTKERVQVFEGLVIAKKHGNGINGTFTVRKVSSGVGVEKIFPIHSPVIDKLEIMKSGRVRRAKIYYIRDATGRRGRLKEVKRKLKNEEEIKEAPKKEISEDAKAEQKTNEVVEKTKEDVVKEESKEEKKEEK